MSKKKEGMINPYTYLGVSDERANEMSEELMALRSESQSTAGILTTLSNQYDRESLVMGMFLAALIMKRERRLLPPDARIVGTVKLPQIDNTGDPSRN